MMKKKGCEKNNKDLIWTCDFESELSLNNGNKLLIQRVKENIIKITWTCDFESELSLNDGNKLYIQRVQNVVSDM